MNPLKRKGIMSSRNNIRKHDYLISLGLGARHFSAVLMRLEFEIRIAFATSFRSLHGAIVDLKWTKK